MMTREEVLSIEEYCAEHKISHKKRLEELGIPFWNFYKAKQKYRKEDEQDAQPGPLVQLSSGLHVPQTMPLPACNAGKSTKQSNRPRRKVRTNRCRQSSHRVLPLQQLQGTWSRC